ncbi:hypothetical protein N665_3080s0007, partial [Sinapis alba]
MKAFHLLLFDGSFIFPECILIFGLILLLMIDSTSDQKDIPWLYFFPSTSFVMSIAALFFRWRKEQYIECTEMTITKLLLFVLTATLGGMILCSSKNLITIFVAPELNGLINTQMYNSPGISIALIFITVGIGFKLSLAPSHQWAHDVYEGVHCFNFSHSNFNIPFYFSSNEWHLLLEILAIFSMILGNLIAITQTSIKRMLAYSSICQIGYVIIGIIVRDSNGGYASMITYMLIPPFRSNNSIELSMIVFVIASTIPGISMNPIIAI